MQQTSPQAVPQAQQQNPLEQLKDIQLPEPLSWWPLAPGWWIVIAVTLIAIALLLVWFFRRRSQNRIKQLAIKQFDAMPEDVSAAEQNSLVKRACLGYFNSYQVADLAGDKWIAFLAQCLPEKHRAAFESDYQAQYFSSFKAEQTPPGKELVSLWLNQALPPKKALISQLQEAEHV